MFRQFIICRKTLFFWFFFILSVFMSIMIIIYVGCNVIANVLFFSLYNHVMFVRIFPTSFKIFAKC